MRIRTTIAYGGRGVVTPAPITFVIEKGGCMNILVIGNGFDLSLGLPTSYADFLNFIRLFQAIYTAEDYSNKRSARECVAELYCRISKMPDRDLQKRLNGFKPVFFKFKKVFESEMLDWIFRDFYYCINENWWSEYIQHRYDKKLIEGENWIDIEQEIKKVIMALENDALNIGNSTRSNVKIEDIMEHVLSLQEHKLRYDISPNAYKTFQSKLKNDFDRFVMALGIYLDVFVRSCDVENNSVKEIRMMAKSFEHNNHVLSFNYIDNYWNEYIDSDFVHEKEIPYSISFVHGSAEYRRNLFRRKNKLQNYDMSFIEEQVKINKMILGFDECMQDEEEASSEFAYYRKQYQRVFKKTDTSYLKWLNEYMEEENSSSSDWPNHVIVFGHSLDSTDAEIFNYFLKREPSDTEITIYYHNEEAHHRIMRNLKCILSGDKYNQMTYAANPTIKIINQSES